MPYGDIGFNIGKNSSGGDNLTNHPNRENIVERIVSSMKKRNLEMGEDGRRIKWGRIGIDNPNYGNKWTSENRQRASEFMKKLYESGNGNFSNRMGRTNREIYGDKIAEEISKKISFHASQRVGDKNPFYNKKHTDETKEIIRKMAIGKKPSNRIKLSIDGVIYDSYHDASKELNIPIVTIRWRCLSKNPKFDNYTLIR